MAITWEEGAASPSLALGAFDNSSVSVTWKLRGSANVADVTAFIFANVPDTYETVYGYLLYRNNYRAEYQSSGLWFVEVTYMPPKMEQRLATQGGMDGIGGAPGGVDVALLNISVSTRTAHITNSLETVASYGPGGAVVPDYKGFIGVQSADQVDGADVEIAEGIMEFENYMTSVQITADLIRTLENMTPGVNLNTYKGDPPGSVLYLGTVFNRRNDGVVVAHTKIKRSRNLADIRARYRELVGDGFTMPIPKKGHELFWCKYGKTRDANGIGKRVEAVYIERIYDEWDFTPLEILG